MYINYIELLFCILRGLHMSNVSGAINRVKFDSATAASSADVVVKGFSNNALQGVLEAISKTNSIISDLQSNLDDIQLNNDKNAKDNIKRDKDTEKNRIASLASERRSRATDEAIHGEIKRGNIFNKMLREGLTEAIDGLTSFLKDNLGKALKTQQDLAATMRKANLSGDEKNQIQALANGMKGVVASEFDGLNVSNEQIKDYISDLIAAGKDVTRMSQSELAGYIAKRRRGIESERAYDLSKTASEDALKDLVLKLGDNQLAGSVNKILGSLDANFRRSLGGTDSALSQITEIASQIEASAGGAMSSDDAASLAVTLLKKQNLNTLGGENALSDQEQTILAAWGSAGSIAEGISNLIERSNVVTSSANILPEYVARLKESVNNDRDIGKALKTDEQIREANKLNTTDGKIPSLFEDVFNSTLGKLTGPLSNWVDEMFGGSTDLVSIVSTGFKIVAGLLGTIATSKLIGGPLSFLKSGIGTLVPGLAKGLSVLLNPMTLAIGAAAASLGYAAYKISDASDRLNRPDEIKKDIRQNNVEIANVQNDLELAKKYNASADTIGKLEAKLAELRKTSQALQNDLQKANEDAKSGSEKAADEYSKRAEEEAKQLIQQSNDKQRLAMLVKDKDEEEYNRLMRERDDLRAQADKTLKDSQKIYATSHGLLASTFDLEPETMLAWSNFTDGVSEFFTEDIPNFFTETIPNALSNAGNWVWDKISSLGKSIYSLIDTYIVTPVGDFFSDIGNSIDENFIKPMKDFFDFNWLPEPVHKFIFDESYSAADMAGDLAGSAMDKGKELLDGAASTVSEGVEFVKNLWPFADGGIVNSATPAVIGEDGKEAVLPLEKPDKLLEVLNKLTNSERTSILKSIISDGKFSVDTLLKIIGLSTKQKQTRSDLTDKIGGPVPGDDPNTINRILSMAGPYRDSVYRRLKFGWKNQYRDGDAFDQRKKWYDEALQNASNQSGRDLIRGTYAERALEYGVSELGKPYILRSLGKIGYVCNELVNACLRASGFDMKKFNFWGVNTTLQEFRRGKYSDTDKHPNFRLREDLTPETALPGMIFFQGSKKNADGSFAPGHIGLVYYGQQKLHASGGSSSYNKNDFLANWQTPCRGVTVTDFNQGPQYLIGEFPDLFKRVNDTSSPSSAQTNIESNGSSSLSSFISKFIDVDDTASSLESNNLAKEYIEAVTTVKNSSSDSAKQAADQFSKAAIQLLGNKSSSPEILAALNSMIKYLRDIASSPSNRKTVPSVSRPISVSY